MKDREFTTPILLVIFNRPDTTQRVFDEIKKVKPKKLFVCSDAARENRLGEAERCQECKDIIKQVDWDCEVSTKFENKNLGCKKAVSSGINWFFENVEEGIILEDDCLPNETFFWFCQEMLEYYRHDTRVMHISGNNFQDGKIRGNGSYYFSNQALIWGWATWRRAWKYFDVDMNSLPEFVKQNQMENICDNYLVQKAYLYHLKKVYNGGNSWAYAWAYTVFVQNGLCITPNVNLIENIGFGEYSIHTKDKTDRYANMARYEINEIIHPTFMIPDRKADLYTYKNHHRYSIRGIIEKTIVKLKSKQFKLFLK